MTMSTIIASAPMSSSTRAHQARAPLATLVIMVPMELGKRAMMLANRMMEMPLPTPNSVTCSPIHMISAEPAMKVMMMTMAGQMPVPSAVSMLWPFTPFLMSM